MTGYLENTGNELLQHCLVLHSHFPKIFHTERALDLYAQRSIRLKRERGEKSGTEEKKKKVPGEFYLVLPISTSWHPGWIWRLLTQALSQCSCLETEGGRASNLSEKCVLLQSTIPQKEGAVMRVK